MTASEYAETIGALERLAGTGHPKYGPWARKRLQETRVGGSLTDTDREQARMAEADALPISRVSDDDPDREYAAHRAKRAIPIAELLGIVPTDVPKVLAPKRRARLPIP